MPTCTIEHESCSGPLYRLQNEMSSRSRALKVQSLFPQDIDLFEWRHQLVKSRYEPVSIAQHDKSRLYDRIRLLLSASWCTNGAMYLQALDLELLVGKWNIEIADAFYLELAVQRGYPQRWEYRFGSSHYRNKIIIYIYSVRNASLDFSGDIKFYFWVFLAWTKS